MLIRALIVLLAVLNLGVAAWWLTRTEPVPPPPEPAVGVATLELVKTPAPPPATVSVSVSVSAPPPAVAAPAAAVDAAAPMPAGTACFRLGPFADRTAAEQARGKLGTSVARTAFRELPGTGASGYRVLLPPAASREQAQAVAQRIGAAGFDDFLVINNGEEANSVALGRYRSREGAMRRQAQLVAAGFPAEIRPIGRESPVQWWLDAAAPASATPAALRLLAGSAQIAAQDCAAVR